MATGHDNKLTGQIGEFLVCAELGRRGIIATPFSGNVPNFDLLVASLEGGSAAIQVKASRGNSWSTQANLWLQLRLEDNKQIENGPVMITDAQLIYVFVAIGETAGQDRYFILTKTELQAIYVRNYRTYMEPRAWMRPRSPASFDCRCTIDDLKHGEQRWELIAERLTASISQP